MRTTLVISFWIFLLQIPFLAGAQMAGPVQQSPNRHITLHAADLLDINTATLDQLKALPGFGMAYARRVIAARPYLSKNQLLTRGVIPAEAYDRVSPFIIAHRSPGGIDSSQRRTGVE